jgi:Phosphotransferase enzyme family
MLIYGGCLILSFKLLVGKSYRRRLDELRNTKIIYLKFNDVTSPLAREIGSLLARIHLERVEGYGDLTDSDHLTTDPRIPFKMKFEEGLEECKDHLPESLLETCRRSLDKDIDFLLSVDGPCVIHRDFRSGNLIAAYGKVQGIIDLSSRRGGFAEDDFCLLELGEWPENSTNMTKKI